MTELATVLLGLISVGVTIIGLLLGYVVRQLSTLKEDVDTLWQAFFGVPDNTEGIKHSFEEEHDDIRSILEETRTEQNKAHDDVKSNFRQLYEYLSRLTRSLEREKEISLPSPEEELDNDFLRGDD